MIPRARIVQRSRHERWTTVRIIADSCLLVKRLGFFLRGHSFTFSFASGYTESESASHWVQDALGKCRDPRAFFL